MTISPEFEHNKFEHNKFEHSHHSDTVTVSSKQKVQLLWVVLGLRSSLFLLQLGFGRWLHSLSLLAVAGHMLSDILTLGLALLASVLAQRPPYGQATFGYQRAEILVALVNGLALMVLSVFIAWKAIGQFQTPPTSSLTTLIVAAVGLAINSLLIIKLHSLSHNDLNLRGAFLHIVADAASFLSVIVATSAVYWLNWQWADAAGSLFVAGLISFSAFSLVWDSLRVLMEFAPPSVDVSLIENTLNSFTDVRKVEMLHIWTITSGQVALCAHLIVEPLPASERDKLLFQLQTHLNQEFNIYESTLQMTELSAQIQLV
ncbi:cation efflux system protein [Rivularia sp. IAM M-261]|nr:cation efflux system protein [Rivularia sp. IAM M-261]